MSEFPSSKSSVSTISLDGWIARAETPYCLLDRQGIILWTNDAFNELVTGAKEVKAPTRMIHEALLRREDGASLAIRDTYFSEPSFSITVEIPVPLTIEGTRVEGKEFGHEGETFYIGACKISAHTRPLLHNLPDFETLYKRTTLPLYLIKTDAEGRYSYMCHRFMRRFGISEDYLGQNCLDSIHEEDHPACIQAVTEAFLQPGKPIPVNLRKPLSDGRFIHTRWEFTATVDTYGNPQDVSCLGVDITNPERTQQDYRVLLEYASDSVIKLNEKGIITYVSPFWEGTHGHVLQKAQGSAFTEFIPHEEYTDVQKFLSRLKGGEAQKPLIHRFQNADSSLTWVETKGRRVTRTGELVLVCRDLTDNFLFQRQLQEKEEMLEAAGEMAKIGGWTYDVESNEVRWTTQTYNIKEVPLDYEITFERAMSFYPESDREKLIAAIQQALTDATPYDLELNFISAKGTHRIVRAIGQATTRKGKVVRLSGTILDISEQKQTQKTLQKQRDLLNQTQQIGRIGGWEMHIESGTIEWTDEVFRIHGLPLGTPPSGEEAFAYYHPEDRPRLAEKFQACIESLIPFDESVRFRSARNENLWLRVTGRAVFAEHKGLTIRGIMHDITADIQIRKKLEKAHDLLAMSQELTSIGSYEGDLRTEQFIASDNLITTLGLEPRLHYSFDEFLNIIHPDDLERGKKEFAAAVKQDEVLRHNLRWIRPDGSLIHVINFARIYKDENGVPIRFEGAMQDVTEQTRVRKELEKTYEHLTSAQAMARLGSFELDFTTQQYTLSQTYREIMGLEPHKAYSYEEINALLHPEDLEEVEAYYAAMVAEQGNFNRELRCVRPDGEIIYVYNQSIITYNEQGMPTRMVGYMQDITQRKLNSLKIQESEERLRLLTEGMDEVFWLRSADNSTVLYVNPAYEKVWGQSIEQLYAEPNSFFEAIHPDDLERVSAIALEYEEVGSYSVEHRIVKPDGTVRWVWARQQAIRDEHGKILSHTGIATDITDRKQDREQIAMLQSVVEGGKDAVVITRAEPLDIENGGPEIIYVNEAFTDMTGYTAAEVIGKTPRMFQGKETNRAKLDRLKKALENWENIEMELINYKKDGTPFWVNFIITPIADDKGHYTHWASIQRDITRRKEQEFEILSAKEAAERASLAKTEFLSTMSHEIRTPLNAVIGMTGLLQDTELTAEQESCVRVIRQGGENLLSVINDILDFNKIEAGQMEIEHESFPLLLPVEEAMEILAGSAHSKGLDLVFMPAFTLPREVKGDITRLRQVLVNLISNAIKFTDQGSVIVHVDLARKEGKQMWIRFRVEDTGVGIPQDKLHRLFRSFSQVDASIRRKYGGSGLGLAISQKLVHLHGGEMEVESETGVGSTFSFSWKVEVEQENDLAINPSLPIDKRLLVIDPSEPLVPFYMGISRKMDTNTSVFSRVSEGLKFLEKEGEHTDMILVDGDVKTTSGKPVWQELRQLYPNIPLIWAGRGYFAKEWKDHFVGVIHKPFRIKEYLEQIEKAGQGFAKDQTSDKRIPKEKESLDLSAFRILVVEDNPINLRVATRILSKFQARIETAQNGQEAVDFMKMGRFDLVLMDMQMPVMDGVSATRIIRSMTEIEQPMIVAMTANVMQEDREACMEAGMNDFITKPIKVGELRQYLSRWLLE